MNPYIKVYLYHSVLDYNKNRNNYAGYVQRNGITREFGNKLNKHGISLASFNRIQRVIASMGGYTISHSLQYATMQVDLDFSEIYISFVGKQYIKQLREANLTQPVGAIDYKPYHETFIQVLIDEGLVFKPRSNTIALTIHGKHYSNWLHNHWSTVVSRW